MVFQATKVGCWSIIPLVVGQNLLLTMFKGEKLERKLSIIVECTITSLGTITQCSSFRISELTIGKIFTGTGNR